MKKLILLIVSLLVFASVNAELVAISQGGYHPLSNKQVVVYTTQASGAFDIRDSTGVVFSGQLEKAKDF